MSEDNDDRSEAIQKTWVPVGTGLVAGLVAGIVVDVIVGIPFAPEIGAVLGGLVGFLFTRMRR